MGGRWQSLHRSGSCLQPLATPVGRRASSVRHSPLSWRLSFRRVLPPSLLPSLPLLPFPFRVDVLLAMQAPLRMERIIPHIVALGVGRLLITSAKKVGREGRREDLAQIVVDHSDKIE